jgi:hypothetical protein
MAEMPDAIVGFQQKHCPRSEDYIKHLNIRPQGIQTSIEGEYGVRPARNMDTGRRFQNQQLKVPMSLVGYGSLMKGIQRSRGRK